ncbi:MAG TPA: hypothetical protein VJO12_17305 [Stellaceae bacterium]|nr:hypothetical protein [Stellaceae bacterium]
MEKSDDAPPNRLAADASGIDRRLARRDSTVVALRHGAHPLNFL